jgi:hypothetical protein
VFVPGGQPQSSKSLMARYELRLVSCYLACQLSRVLISCPASAALYIHVMAVPQLYKVAFDGYGQESILQAENIRPPNPKSVLVSMIDHLSVLVAIV